MNAKVAATQEACKQEGAADNKIARTAHNGAVRGWRTVGAARRFGDGLRFAVVCGPGEGEYAVEASDANRLLIDLFSVPLYEIDPQAGPVEVGRAKYSDSGRMILLDLPQYGGRHGAVQVSAMHICTHYLRGDRDPVPVVAPPEPVPVGVPA